MGNFDFLVLAGGTGSRLKSDKPKALHKVAGLEIVMYPLKDAAEIGAGNIIVVVGEELNNTGFLNNFKTVLQPAPSGTGAAVLLALPFIKSEYVLVTYADMPLVTKDDYMEILKSDAEIACIGVDLPDHLSKMPYGRIIDTNNKFEKIVEYKDATNQERDVRLINSGVYKIKTTLLQKYLKDVRPNPLTNEIYITDFINIAANSGAMVEVIKRSDYDNFHGVNTKIDLAKAEAIMQNKLRGGAMLKFGTTMVNPDSVILSHDTIIGHNCTIEPNVVIGNRVVIKDNVTIKSFSYIEDCIIEDGASVGPFARIRGGTTLMQNSSIGNFVEIKGSTIGRGSKAKHLSYIGDATLAERVNIGAGTITCNYDGFKKHKCHIGEGTMIGSNTSIISPVRIGANAMIGAGSVITKNVPDEALAISRSDQKILEHKSRLKKR